MKYSDAELRSLVGRATPLHQRRNGLFEYEPGHPDAARRLERWRHVLSIEGDERLFADRLAFDELDEASCLRALGYLRLSEHEPYPAWAARLNSLLSGGHSARDLLPWLFDSAEGLGADLRNVALPFVEVWVPFVAGATHDLRARAGALLNHLSRDVLTQFEALLLSNLADAASLPLSLTFRRFQARNDPLSLLSRSQADAPDAPRDSYDSFVRHLQGGGLSAFFQDYAVLARMMSDVIGYWVDSVEEFCRRLDQDRAALAQIFHHGVDPGPVVKIRMGLSDPHHGRRDVIIPTFASGLRLVYKPKDLSIDQAFWRFIDWLNQQSADAGHLPLRTLTVLNRTTHGWVEFVEDEACADAPAIQRYYRRTGMLLCVAYALGATDFHQDNIIASGEQPVLVDLETMLQTLPRSFDGLRSSSADERAVQIMHDSVMRVGLLPFWIAGDRGKSYDVSGIGAEGPTETGRLEIEWESVNTDRMRPVYRTFVNEEDARRPTLNGDMVSARDYSAEIIDGFARIYRLMLSRREVLLAEDGPLSCFRGVKLRCLLRMTKAYAQLLNRRMHPEYLRDGADGAIETERLARDFLVLDPEPGYPAPWGVFRAEAKALERLDIPLFTFLSDSKTLYADGHAVAQDFFAETGLQRASSMVRKLSEEDLGVQTDFIRASLHARYVDTTTASEREAPHHDASTDSTQPPLTREEFIKAALAIAAEIRRSAISGADGGVTWLSMAFDPGVDRMNFLPMTDNLYDGRVGVALFLAALEHITGGAGFRDLALAALQPLRKALRHRVPTPAVRTSLGGAAGVGGNVYALVRIADWLGNAELLDLAKKAAGWIVPKRIRADESLDVFGGAAGGILGLLALPAEHSSGLLNSAVECGDHLLLKRVTASTGHRAWPGRWESRPLTGFGHGAAGIAYALLRLSQVSGETRFREAAEEAIAYETAVYSADQGNWPDFRESREGGSSMVAWCNGATGIGLGRLGALPLLDTPALRQDAVNALETTRSTAPGDEDHLCCGNLGRFDLLIEASECLARPELLEEARQRGSTVVRRAARNGHYGLFAQVPGVTDSFSFFQGTAGIGYQLLRLVEPGKLPSVLIWK